MTQSEERTQNAHLNNDYDVIIVGGAMTGCTLALALTEFAPQIKVAIIERKRPPKHQSGGFDARVIAFSHGTCQKFQQLHFDAQHSIWQKLIDAHCDIQTIHISDQGHSCRVKVSADDMQLSRLGAVVELSQMGHTLLDAIQQHPHIDYLCPQQVERIERCAEHVSVYTQTATYQSKLLVAADGNPSQTALACDVEYKQVSDYKQTAIIANIRCQLDHQHQAFERFTHQGPVALLPMADKTMTLVWCVHDPTPLLALNDTQFLEALQQQFGWRLGKLGKVTKRFAYPLVSQKATQHIQQRTALVGNAAQLLHPIAGQGFNLAIRDCFALAHEVATHFNNQQDIGSFTCLDNYQQRRRGDQQRLINLTDGLVHTFSNNYKAVALARNLGLFALSASSTLQQQFFKTTLGWLE